MTSPAAGDPAADISRPHPHEHANHGGGGGGHVDDDDKVTYAQGNLPEGRQIPPQFSRSHSRDLERGGEGEGEEEKRRIPVVGTVVEKRSGSGSGVSMVEEGGGGRRSFYSRYKVYVHAFVFCLFTGWWIASLVLHRHDKNWVIPFLLWLCIVLRIFFLWVPIKLFMRPVQTLWKATALRFVALIPASLRIPAAALLAIGVILIGAFVSEESLNNTRDNRAVSLFGLLVFIVVLWGTSKHRAHVKWHTVIVGMLMQFIIALFVLRTGVGYDIFNFISDLARSLLSFAHDGVAFLTTAEIAEYTMFFFSVLPAIIFFVSLVQLLYHWGVLQWFIGKFAVFFFWSMQVSGAEAVVAAASPFIGQGESAMLIRPFVPHLTLAELHQVMTSGYATIAGSVLVAYIGMGINPQALISSCVMSIPASLAISKLRYPETEESLTAGKVIVPEDPGEKAANSIHAFANGAWLGLKIAGMILSTLLCILALLGLVNGLLGWWGRYLNINDPPLSVELIVGYVCYPIAFLIGVSRDGDLYKVAQLIGTKLIANEFVAYTRLQQEPQFQSLSDRSRLIATYALCGFANLGSLGTQIGVLSQVAPSRAGDVSKLAVSALISGAISTLSSASVAGLVVTNQRQFTTSTPPPS